MLFVKLILRKECYLAEVLPWWEDSEVRMTLESLRFENEDDYEIDI